MGVKLGSFAIPSSSTFSITGLGFKPRWIIFLCCNSTPGDADAWTPRPSASIGWAAMQNSETDDSGVAATLRNSQVSELWYNTNVAGSFLGDGITWIRNNGLGGDHWSMYTQSLDTDGFTLAYGTDDSGFVNINAVGKQVYYLAGDETWEEVGATLAFVPGSPDYELNWEPQAFFGIGAGGDLGDAPRYSASFFDLSVPSVMGGHFDPDSLTLDPIMIAMWRGIIDPNIDVQEWWGYNLNTDVIDIIEEQQGGGVQFSTEFAPSVVSDTKFHADFPSGFSFSSYHVRMQPFILGKAVCATGSFMPSATTGVWTPVNLPFSPEAVVFFSPQSLTAGIFGTSLYGATVYGFCTDEDQAVLGFGGFWNPPTPQTSAQMHSPNLAWISNCIDTGTIGTVVSAGSARCTGAGFEHRTEYHNASILYPVLYWAIAPDEEAPGFFRII